MRVDGQDVRCVGVAQQLHIDGKCFTRVYVTGCLRSKRPHMLLEDTSYASLDGQFAYMTDAHLVNPVERCGDFEYELTLLERIPLIEEGDGNI